MSLSNGLKNFLFDEESDIEIEDYEDFTDKEIEISGFNKSKAKTGIVNKIKSFYLKHLENKKARLEARLDKANIEAAISHDSTKADKINSKIDALDEKIQVLDGDLNHEGIYSVGRAGAVAEDDIKPEEPAKDDMIANLIEEQNSIEENESPKEEIDDSEEQKSFDIPDFLKNTLDEHNKQEEIETDAIEKEINEQIKNDVNDLMDTDEVEPSIDTDIQVGTNSDYEQSNELFNTSSQEPEEEYKAPEEPKENPEKEAHDNSLVQFENNFKAKMMQSVEELVENIRREDEEYFKRIIDKVINDTADKMRNLDSEFQKEKTSMQVEISTLRNSYESEKEKSESQAKTLDENKQTIEDLNRGLKFTNQTIDELNSENESLRAQIASLESEKKALRVTVSTLMREGLSAGKLVNQIPEEEIDIPKTL